MKLTVLMAIAVFLCALVVGSMVEAYATMPVYEWCEWSSDNTTLYRIVSPTHWDKWTNSQAWQRWEAAYP